MNVSYEFILYSTFVYVLPLQLTIYGHSSSSLYFIQTVFDEETKTYVEQRHDLLTKATKFIEPQLCDQWDTRTPYMCYNNKLKTNYTTILHYNNNNINCVPNESYCSTDISCPAHQVACPTRETNKDQSVSCQNFSEDCSCPQYTCPNGQCTKSFQEYVHRYMGCH